MHNQVLADKSYNYATQKIVFDGIDLIRPPSNKWCQ